MSPSTSAKGKRRAAEPLIDDLDEGEPSRSSPATPVTSSSQTRPAKKPKRAETRPCPICFEHIPLRLLEQHADLESERLQSLIASIGDSTVYIDPHGHLNPLEELPASRRRTVRQPAPKPSTPISQTPTSEPDPHTLKTLNALKRRRKQRTQALRDIIDDTLPSHGRRRVRHRDGAGEDEREGEQCPVCTRMVWGDPDVVAAHVDACLAHHSMAGGSGAASGSGGRGAGEGSSSTPEMDVNVDVEYDGPSRLDNEDIWEETTTPDGHIGLRLRVGGVGSASRGAAQRLGFVVGSNRSGLGGGGASQGDVDGEVELDVDVDVDGDDEGAFGAEQFREEDVIKLTAGIGANTAGEDADVDVDRDDGEDAEGPPGSKTPEPQLSPLEVAERALSKAKLDGDAQGTIEALETIIRLRNFTPVPPLPSKGSSASTVISPFNCRICLDAYTEPTTSIGCWHVCCKECWLRCLGSTKLCPICMRITGVGELRRVYL